VCVCVCERERARERRQIDRERESVCGGGAHELDNVHAIHGPRVQRPEYPHPCEVMRSTQLNKRLMMHDTGSTQQGSSVFSALVGGGSGFRENRAPSVQDTGFGVVGCMVRESSARSIPTPAARGCA